MCTTCQSCSCDNVTLPIVTGPTGSTGATGATGPAGAAGTPGVAGTGGFIVLHNDMVQSTTTSGSLGAFTTDKTYTLPLNTLSINGSKLIITGLFAIQENAAAAGNAADVAVFFDGSNFTSKSMQATAANIEVGCEMKIRLEVSRLSATTVLINTDFYVSDDSTGKTLEHKHFTKLSTTTPNLTTAPMVINLRGATDVGTLDCDQFTIDHLII